MGSKLLGFVATMAGVGLLSSLSQAQGAFGTCTQDDDCPTGTRCSVSMSGGGTDPSEPPQAFDLPRDQAAFAALAGEGTCEPLPDGVCESDRDCDQGFGCVKGEWAAGCGAAEGGELVCEPSFGTSRYGACELKPIECASDTDCPNGLSCVTIADVGDAPSGGGSNGDGGGTTGSIGVGKAAIKACTFVLQACEATSDCATNYECALSESTVCSAGAAGPDIGCDAESGDCFSAIEEPECTVEQTEGVCVPKRIPCTGDFECPNAYVCHEVDAELVPPSWGVSGAAKSCLPEGIALIARYSARDLGAPGSAGFDGDDRGEGTNGPNEEAASRGAFGATKSGDGSACSVSAARGGSSWLLGVFGALGLALVRRRRSA